LLLLLTNTDKAETMVTEGNLTKKQHQLSLKPEKLMQNAVLDKELVTSLTLRVTAVFLVFFVGVTSSRKV